MSQIDLNSILNELIYKIAGVLLPMIYVMIASNRLIAAQVSDGSMAYVLSTPTNRKTVVRTQYVFLIMTVSIMYVAITVAAVSEKYFSIEISFFILPLLSYCWGLFLQGSEKFIYHF
jgi:ABC-2 type transport system permease protein